MKVEIGGYVEEEMLGEPLTFDEITEMVGELIVLDNSTESHAWYKVVKVEKITCNKYEEQRRLVFFDGKKQRGMINEIYFDSNYRNPQKAWRLKHNDSTEVSDKSYFEALKEVYPGLTKENLLDVIDYDFCPGEFFEGADDIYSNCENCDGICERCWNQQAAFEYKPTENIKIPDVWNVPIETSPDIEVLGLDIRTYNIVKRAGINTIDDLEKKKNRLKKVISPLTYSEIIDKLDMYSNNSDTETAVNDTESTSDDALIYIDVNLIDPHPDNPRKNVGDVTELADSIKSNGIMQNLNVIPATEGRYLALIGHRRLAASKAAGLEKVPCKVITGLSRSEQVGIMLAENMQRADLTIVEQVEGIQLMLDLGDTVDTVADKTGLSKSTVYRRSKIADYDMETVKKSFEDGASLEDYDLLGKVKDPEKRKELVKSIGTNNFKWSVENAIKAEKRDEQMAPYVELLDFYAEKIVMVDHSTMDYYKGIDTDKGTPEELIYADFFEAGREYFYIYSSWSSYISVYVKREAKEDATEQVQTEEKQIVDTEEQKRTEERRERIEKLRAVFKSMKESTLDFIRNFKTFPAKKDSEKLHIIYSIMDIITEAMCDDDTNGYDFSDYCTLMGIEDEPDDDTDVFEWSLDQLSDLTGEKKFLAIAYMNVAWPGHTPDFIDGVGRYREDKNAIRAYELLKLCGYELSDEEREILNGTHELYTKEND